ncbi:Restriction endonuclease [Pelagirhabdus alkalitolerans]|uniref:Restriction endonuclease n=1 Tax=Pelagirhabdus alkalitolerans TaxID=1612202 RepID=A0A1G6I2R3_9BACI|nr:restriction endonuclease [Pelagirhabdus alkalitolerans]SDC00764.1 Restriction endonuclease [Pelagirhabdus alkalitolerans]
MLIWIFLVIIIGIVLLNLLSIFYDKNDEEIVNIENKITPIMNNDIEGNVIHNIYHIFSDSEDVVNTTLVMEDDALIFKTPSKIESIILGTELYRTEIVSGNTLRIFDQTDKYKEVIISEEIKKLNAIDSFFKSLTVKNRNKMIQFKKKVEVANEQLIANEELVKLAEGFITKIDQNIFRDFNYYIVLERSLLFYSPIGLFSLDISSQNYYKSNSVNEGYENVVDMNIISNYINEHFNSFAQIYNRFLKSELSEREIYIFLWDYLKRIAVPLFGNEFIYNYSHAFDKESNIETIIEKSLYHNIINFDNMETMSLFTYYTMDSKYLDTNNFIYGFIIIMNKYLEIRKFKELKDYEEMLLVSEEEMSKEITINDIDLMSGYDFEGIVGKLFEKMDYVVEITKSSGDQGVDVIANKYNHSIGIQTKLYSRPVNNNAVQEVVAGLKYYKLSKGYVITNNYFTDSAIKLAESNNIVLWDRDELIDKLNRFKVMRV